MKDDSEELAKEVYAHFGLAIYFAQILEHGLVNALVYADLLQNRKPNQTVEDFDLFMDTNFEKTMGELIQSFKKHVSVPTEFDQLLLDVRTKRNFLAHRYFRARAKEFVTEGGSKRMIVELEAARDLFIRTDAALSEMFRPVREKLGITDEVIESHRREIIATAQPNL